MTDPTNVRILPVRERSDEELSADLAGIAAKVRDLGPRIGHPPAFFTAYQAQVETRIDQNHSAPLVVDFTANGAATIYLDAVTAHNLYMALDKAYSVCAGCNLPGLIDYDLSRCPNVGDWLHDDDCHRAVCSQCFDGPGTAL